MSKGLDNGYKFNITCKKCNSNNITAEEQDGYIKLICLECEKLEIYSDKIEDEESENQFIRRLILDSKNKKSLKKLLIEVLNDSDEALIIQNKIKSILDKQEIVGDDGCVVVYNNSPFKDDIFKLCEELNGLTVISGIYGNMLDITVYNIPVLDKKWNMYELGYYSYGLTVTDCYEVELGEISKYQDDTILMSFEIDGHIEVYEGYVEKLKKYIKNL